MTKSKIRDIVKWLMPHGYMLSRNRNNFLRDYDEWKAQGGQEFFDTTCRFSSFVSIDGFGSSGSSAVMDLLREYDCCTVWATKPSFTSSKEVTVGMGELNVMRGVGGMLYIGKMLDSDATANVYWQDAAIKSFMGLAYYSDIYRNHKELRPLLFHFFERLLQNEGDLVVDELFRIPEKIIVRGVDVFADFGEFPFVGEDGFDHHQSVQPVGGQERPAAFLAAFPEIPVPGAGSLLRPGQKIRDLRRGEKGAHSRGEIAVVPGDVNGGTLLEKRRQSIIRRGTRAGIHFDDFPDLADAGLTVTHQFAGSE